MNLLERVAPHQINGFPIKTRLPPHCQAWLALLLAITGEDPGTRKRSDGGQVWCGASWLCYFSNTRAERGKCCAGVGLSCLFHQPPVQGSLAGSMIPGVLLQASPHCLPPAYALPSGTPGFPAVCRLASYTVSE